MSFVNSIILLLSLACAICLPYFVGHGLALGEWGWILTGIGFGLLSGILMFAHSKIAARGAREERTSH